MPARGRLVALGVVTLTVLLVQGAGAAVAFTKGTYNGLFYQVNGTNPVVDVQSSGFLVVRVTEGGAFSGIIDISPTASLPGLKHSLSGQFDGEGKKTLSLAPQTALGDSVTLNLQYPPPEQTDAITGQLSCTAGWNAQLLASRTYDSQPPQAGTYTLSLPKPATDQGPEGLGAGKVTVSLAGRLTCFGKLPDGTAFAQSVGLCKDGRWPLYASLYGGTGSMVGWVEFDGGSSLQGAVGWTKPAKATAKYYNQGLTNVVDLMGLPYTAPRVGYRPVNFKKALVVFSGGGLSSPFTNEVNLSPSGLVANTTRTHLRFRIDRLTGQFTGNAQLPDRKGLVPVRGAIFQAPLDEGYGYFLRDGRSGAVVLFGDYR